MPWRWSLSRPMTRIGTSIGAMRSWASGRLARARTHAGSRICISSMSRSPVCGLTGAASPSRRSRNSWFAGSLATPAGVAGGQEALHDVRAAAHPLPQPVDPAPAVAIGEENEREPPLVGWCAHHVGHVKAITRLGQVVRSRAGRTLDIFHEERLAGAPPLGLSLIHISEPTRLGMISYAVFCLKKK